MKAFVDNVEQRVEFMNLRAKYLLLVHKELNNEITEDEKKELVATHIGPDGENFVVTSMASMSHPSARMGWAFGLEPCPETWCETYLDCPVNKAVYDSGEYMNSNSV